MHQISTDFQDSFTIYSAASLEFN